MADLKVGDRVRVYGWDFDDPKEALIFNAEVLEKLSNGMLKVRNPRLDGDDFVHPKQCRKLVKKERRRVWIHFNEKTPEREICHLNPPGKNAHEVCDGNCIEFREVKRK